MPGTAALLMILPLLGRRRDKPSMEAFLDHWAQCLWSFVTPGRIRRCAIMGSIVAVIASVAGWALMPPLPRWKFHFGTRGPLAQQLLVGFSPGGRWLAVVGYRGVPQNDVLRLWDLRAATSLPAHTIPLPWGSAPNSIPRHYGDGTLLQWSADDRELCYLVRGLYGQPDTIRFINLEQGVETGHWTVPELQWTSPEKTYLTPSMTLPVERIEFSPSGNWIILRRDYGVAVADRHSGHIVLALNAARAVMQPDDRHLLVQELVVTRVAPSVFRKVGGNWVECDLVTGEQIAVDANHAPPIPNMPQIVAYADRTSSDGRLFATLPNQESGEHRMSLYDLPLGPPWGTITLVAIGSALLTVLLMELAVGWWNGFEVSEVVDPNQDG